MSGMEYILAPAETNETYLFFRLEGEAAERSGAICGMQIDFEQDERGAITYRFNCQRHLATQDFKADLKRVMDYLGRAAEFRSIDSFGDLCREHEGRHLTDGDINVPHTFGVKTQTENYTYYFRCHPLTRRVNIFAYDNRYLLPELAGKHNLPDKCFSLSMAKVNVIVITRGESGFEIFDSCVPPEGKREEADNLNSGLGVTRAQEEAMLAGWSDGWDSPGAKPWRYDMDGTPRKPPKRNEPERG